MTDSRLQQNIPVSRSL